MQSGGLSLDHVFVLSETAGEQEVRALRSLGFTESSRRSHAGLGTSNAFFCFDNFFLEVLWIRDAGEARLSLLGQQLLARLEGRSSGAIPFGLGFRSANSGDPLPFETSTYATPEASGLRSVPVARSSQDVGEPLLFRAQRTLRPDQWVDGKAGERQRPAGWVEVLNVRYTPPPARAASADLESLAERGLLSLGSSRAGPDVELTIVHLDGHPSWMLSLREL